MASNFTQEGKIHAYISKEPNSLPETEEQRLSGEKDKGFFSWRLHIYVWKYEAVLAIIGRK
jgi:hypothetical protein